MPDPIEFYFDFSSPYGYIMSEKIDHLAARYGRKVHWKPILLGLIFQATGSIPPVRQHPAKADYIVRDFARSARFMGVPYNPPSRFPLPTQAAARAYYWLHGEDCGQARALAHSVFRAFFVDDRDISAPEVILDLADGLDIDRDKLATALQSPEIKERVKTECDAALEKGVFGSPFVLIDGEGFFGADRLPQIEKWLETGGF